MCTTAFSLGPALGHQPVTALDHDEGVQRFALTALLLRRAPWVMPRRPVA